jgi:formamidopyrimidine-DNA glycosylase
MPELPEVQTVVDQLDERLTGRRIALGGAFLWPGTAGYPEADALIARVTGRQVAGVRRRAKYILVDLGDDLLLVIHLRMTGNLHFAAPEDPAHPYLRARLPLDNGQELRFADMRKFGRLYAGVPDELDTVIPLARLGPEPLDEGFTPAALGERLAGKRGPIKSALLDQSVLAGLGNIYVDEALFRAGIAPLRPAGSLAAVELDQLHAGIVAALREALANRGTTFRDYLSVSGEMGDNEPNLQVFRRHGQSCVRCGQPLARIVVGGRGTHYCPNCQR